MRLGYGKRGSLELGVTWPPGSEGRQERTLAVSLQKEVVPG